MCFLWNVIKRWFLFISVKKLHHQKENFSLYNFYIKHFFIKSFLFRVNSVKNTLIQFKTALSVKINSSGMKKYECFLWNAIKKWFLFISVKKIHHQKENFSLCNFYIKHFFIKSFLFRVVSVKNTLIQFKTALSVKINSSGMKKYECFLWNAIKKVIFVHISKKNTSSEREFFTLQLLYKAFFHKIIPFQSSFS